MFINALFMNPMSNQVCAPVIERCKFLLWEIRPVLGRQECADSVLVNKTRFRSAVERVIANLKSGKPGSSKASVSVIMCVICFVVALISFNKLTHG